MDYSRLSTFESLTQNVMRKLKLRLADIEIEKSIILALMDKPIQGMEANYGDRITLRYTPSRTTTNHNTYTGSSSTITESSETDRGQSDDFEAGDGRD